MTTGAAWNVTNPRKPYALFDADAIRDIPFDWTDWLADIGTTYASHMITCEDGLQCVNPTTGQNAGIISARIEASGSVPLIVGTYYFVTCHIVALDGQEDDQTLYLKITVK